MTLTILITMFVGLALTIVSFVMAAGPAVMLAVLTPFDAIPFRFFGFWGNLITFVPILIMFMKTSPGRWGDMLVGSRVQQLAVLVVMLLLVSHATAIVDRGLGEILEWLRKVTLLLLVAVFAKCLTKDEHILIFVRALVVSFTVFTLLSMSDYYLGIQILPLPVHEHTSGTLDLQYRSWDGWRFTGAGFPVNRFANYITVPIFLGVGWAMRARGTVERVIVVAMTAVLLLALVQTVSRSSLGGLMLAFVVMAPMAFSFRPQQILAIVVLGGLFGSVIYYAATVTSAADVLGQRFDVGHIAQSSVGRVDRFVAALQIWAKSPLIGVGWANFKVYSPEYLSSGGLSAHSGYLRILAEAGILGFVPFVFLLGTVIRQLLTSVRSFAPDLEFWRPYFLGALIAQLFSNIFNDYAWERFLWLTIAFAVILERATTAERLSRFQARMQEMTRARGRSLAGRRHLA